MSKLPGSLYLQVCYKAVKSERKDILYRNFHRAVISLIPHDFEPTLNEWLKGVL